MSTEITTAFVQQYNANVFHLSQQKGSRLQDAVRLETQVGKNQFFDRIGAVTARKVVDRHADTQFSNTPHSRRRVSLNDYDYADLVDNEDKIRMLIDPTSEYAIAAVMALGRQKDNEILDAMSGDAFGDETGSTTVSLPTTQKIASVSGGAGSNLNIQALRRAKRVLDGNDVDEAITRYCAINASGLESLLNETEVTSADFNSVRALVMGEIDTFLGFKFIRLELLNAQSGALSFNVTTGVVGSGAGDADTYRKAICWAQDGVILSTGADIKTRIDELPLKRYSTGVFASMGIGSTRMEEEKIVEVLYDDTI